MNKRVSFIIPSYNVEKYLDICLGSFVIPEFMDQFEVLVVDDGSSDRTAEIAENYVSRFPQTYRLLKKKNGGHGSAINAGSLAAQGTYFKVVDADDWIESNFLSLYLSALKSTQADVVVNAYITENVQTGERKTYGLDSEPAHVETSLSCALNNQDICQHGFSLHGITYRTAFYRQWKNLLSENVFYEDHEFAAIPSCFADSVILLDFPLYVYRIGDGNQSIAMENQLKRCHHIQTILHKMEQFYLTNEPHFNKAATELYYLKLEIVLNSYYKVVLLAEPDKKKGRLLASRENARLKNLMPALWGRTYKKYLIFLGMNHLHLSVHCLEQIFNSSIYKRIKKRQE